MRWSGGMGIKRDKFRQKVQPESSQKSEKQQKSWKVTCSLDIRAGDKVPGRRMCEGLE